MNNQTKLFKSKQIIQYNILKIEELTQSIEYHKNIIIELEKNNLETTIKCCNKLFVSKSDLEKHKQTKSHKLLNEPYFRCELCNIPIFDGVGSKNELSKYGGIKDGIRYNILKSNYREHKKTCISSCTGCDPPVLFTTRHQKQTHKCKRKEKELTNNCVSKEQYHVVKETKKTKKLENNIKIIEKPKNPQNGLTLIEDENMGGYKYFYDEGEKYHVKNGKVFDYDSILVGKIINNEFVRNLTYEQLPSPSSSVTMSVSEIDTDTDIGEEELEDWTFNNKSYGLTNKDEVYNNEGVHIGYKYQNRIIDSDDELYEDYIDYLKYS